MELVMKTDLAILPKAIEYNHEELKQQLAVELEKYKGLIVTEDAICSAKADRANLNKFKEALDAKRKEVKKECLQPYEVFEKKIREIIGMIEEPIKAIDSQIKFFENQKKEEKKKEIEKLYLDEIGDLKEWIPLDKLWNPKWMNVTFQLADIALELEVSINRAQSAMEIIKELHCELEHQIMDKFLQTLDVNSALIEKKRLETQKKKLEEMHEKQQAENLKHPIETIKQEPEKQEPEKQKQKVSILQNQIKEMENSMEQRPMCLDFRVWVNPQQMEQLKHFLIENNIKYGRVPQAI